MSALFLMLCVFVFVMTGSPSLSAAQTAGASTDSQSTKTTGQGSTLERTKTLSVESRTSAMVTVPISPLIGEAWGELVRAGKIPDLPTCERPWMKPPIAQMAFKDEATALSCAFYLGYLYAFMPTMGWSMSPEKPEGKMYTLRAIAHVLRVNNLASDIAAQVASSSYKNPEEAKTAIKELLKENRAYMLEVYTGTFFLMLMPSIIDMAHAKDVAFTYGAYHLTLGAGGAVLKYSGVDWFGNGNLSGKRYELQLASMTGVALNRSRTVAEGSEQKTGEGDKAQVGVK